jgi:hypothetical protein
MRNLEEFLRYPKPACQYCMYLFVRLSGGNKSYFIYLFIYLENKKNLPGNISIRRFLLYNGIKGTNVSQSFEVPNFSPFQPILLEKN